MTDYILWTLWMLPDWVWVTIGIGLLSVCGLWLGLIVLKRRTPRKFNGWPVPFVVLALVAPADAGERLNAQIAGLSTVCQFRPFDPPSEWDSIGWQNTTGHPLYLREARVWVGADQHGIADINTQLVRASDGQLLVFMPFDHYAEPSQPIIERVSFVPDYVTIAPGDGLILRQACVQWIGTTPFQTAAAAWISVTTERP